ncbi:MAG: hypothetical protein H0T42_05445, partial [Deltaproteobacteria bacterium]|nr:hypothetical protein [Deltaproteobacteria bacterium]
MALDRDGDSDEFAGDRRKDSATGPDGEYDQEALHGAWIAGLVGDLADADGLGRPGDTADGPDEAGVIGHDHLAQPTVQDLV